MVTRARAELTHCAKEKKIYKKNENQIKLHTIFAWRESKSE